VGESAINEVMSSWPQDFGDAPGGWSEAEVPLEPIDEEPLGILDRIPVPEFFPGAVAASRRLWRRADGFGG
jgi:hypothetical protein